MTDASKIRFVLVPGPPETSGADRVLLEGENSDGFSGHVTLTIEELGWVAANARALARALTPAEATAQARESEGLPVRTSDLNPHRDSSQ